MRLTSPLTLLLLLVLAPACGPGGGTGTASSTTDASTTGATGTADTGSSSGPTTNPVTTGPVTTGEPATTTGEPATTTGEPATSTTTGEPVTSTTGGTTGGPGSSSDTNTTGEPPLGACVSDGDCALHDDCCDCYGVPNGQVDPSCDLRCEQSTCSQLGIDMAVCRFGVCITEKLDCDGIKVVCKSLPPECLEGQLPGVMGSCWSGSCVPIRNCNAVPDCKLCPEGEMCVQKVGKPQSWPVCEPIPVECGGEIDCGCAGSAVCIAPFDACNDQGGNQLSCGCPVC